MNASECFIHDGYGADGFDLAGVTNTTVSFFFDVDEVNPVTRPLLREKISVSSSLHPLSS